MCFGLLFELIMMNAGCSKSKGVIQPSVLLIKGRVVEFGTELPISNATFLHQFCVKDDFFGCAEYRTVTSTADANGLLTIPSEYLSGSFYYSSNEFSKSGYWSNSKSFQSIITSYGYDLPKIIFYTNNTNNNDSFHVKLFPLVNISVHIKNTGPVQMAGSLECQGIFSSNENPRSSYSTFLRAGIDTVFSYPVFGNVQNRIYVKKTQSSGMTDTLFTNTRLIAKGDNISLDIIY